MSGFLALIDLATPAELRELEALTHLGDAAFEQGVSGMPVLCATRYGPAHYETALITPAGGLKYLSRIGYDLFLPRFDTLDELVGEIVRVYYKLYQPEHNRKKRQRAKVRRQKWLAAHPK